MRVNKWGEGRGSEGENVRECKKTHLCFLNLMLKDNKLSARSIPSADNKHMMIYSDTNNTSLDVTFSKESFGTIPK